MTLIASPVAALQQHETACLPDHFLRDRGKEEGFAPTEPSTALSGLLPKHGRDVRSMTLVSGRHSGPQGYVKPLTIIDDPADWTSTSLHGRESEYTYYITQADVDELLHVSKILCSPSYLRSLLLFKGHVCLQQPCPIECPSTGLCMQAVDKLKARGVATEEDVQKVPISCAAAPTAKPTLVLPLGSSVCQSCLLA